MSNEHIECPRCGRLSFHWETNTGCTECRWVIRPTIPEHTFGCDVLIELRDGLAARKMVERHYKGNETTARRRAKSVPKFKAVLSVVPLSEEQFVRSYGVGKM